MIFKPDNSLGIRDDSDFRRKPSGPIKLAAGQSEYEHCECGHIRGLHAGNSRCIRAGCGCQMFRPDAISPEVISAEVISGAPPDED